MLSNFFPVFHWNELEKVVADQLLMRLAEILAIGII